MRVEPVTADSELFGIKIGHLVGDGSCKEVPEVVRSAKSEGFICLYRLEERDRADTIRALSAASFVPVDIRVELGAEIDGLRMPVSEFDLGLATEDDISELISASRGAFSLSRFYSDGNFEKSKCDELYARWIAKDCKDGGRFVATARCGGQLAGFWSASISDDGAARTGLTFVSARFRGKGVAVALFRYLSAVLARHGVKSLAIATQGRNIAALRAYMKCGFRLTQIKMWFHAWI